MVVRNAHPMIALHPKSIFIPKLHYPASSSATKPDDAIIHGLVKAPLGIILQPVHMVESLTLFLARLNRQPVVHLYCDSVSLHQ